jgi:hypothetical protein
MSQFKFGPSEIQLGTVARDADLSSFKPGEVVGLLASKGSPDGYVVYVHMNGDVWSVHPTRFEKLMRQCGLKKHVTLLHGFRQRTVESPDSRVLAVCTGPNSIRMSFLGNPRESVVDDVTDS